MTRRFRDTAAAGEAPSPARGAGRVLPSACRIAAAIALALPPSGLAGCANPQQILTMTVERYLSAVQQRDDEEMAMLWAPYRREISGLQPADERKKYEVFQGRVRQTHVRYDQAKREGVLPPDPMGIALFRGLGLGRGAVALPLTTRIEPDGASAHVRTRVVTNLETLHLESLPDGVRIYLMGYPIGGIEMISVGFDALEKHHLLESVDIDWTLSRAAQGVGTPTGWLIESIAADPNTAVEWKPKARS
jgi:hypothetical protein